jgi:hypothetical protein
MPSTKELVSTLPLYVRKGVEGKVCGRRSPGAYIHKRLKIVPFGAVSVPVIESRYLTLGSAPNTKQRST